MEHAKHNNKNMIRSPEKKKREKTRRNILRTIVLKLLKFDVKTNVRDFLAFQWLKPLVFNAGDMVG